MAEAQGNGISYGSAGTFYAVIEVWDSGATTGGAVTVYYRYKVRTTQSMSDSSNSISWTDPWGSGSAHNSGISHGSGGGTTIVGGTYSQPHSVQYGNSGTIRFTMSVSGLANGSGTSTAVLDYQLPARLPVPPGSPGTSADNIKSNSARIVVTAPSSNGGAGIDQYAAYVLTNNAWPGAGGNVVSQATGGTYTATGLSPNTTYYYTAHAHNSAGWSSWTPMKVFKTLASAPTAPSAVTASRTSDTSLTVSWTRNATSGAPYDNILVQRQIDGGSWTTLSSSVAGTATSYTDTTTSANHTYAYRVAAKNNGGTSSYTASAAIPTTPAAPSNVVGARGTGATVELSWQNNAVPAHEIIIQESDGAGGWTAQATLVSGTTSWTDTSPNAGTTQYRVRARTLDQTLVSSWATSNTVVVLTPPNPPTNLGPAAVQVAGASSYQVTWKHNPIDASTQTRYQIRYRLVGDTTWIQATSVASTNQYGDFPANGLSTFSGQYEWQVRTWGAHANAGDWSSSGILSINNKPAATITAPGDDVTTSRTSVSWTYYDQEGTTQAAWQVELLNSTNQVVENRTGSSTATSVSLNTTLPDSTTWTVRVRVRDGAGLWSDYATKTFDVGYALPPVPNVEADWVWETGTVQLSVDNPEPLAASYLVAVNHAPNPAPASISGWGAGSGITRALVVDNDGSNAIEVANSTRLSPYVYAGATSIALPTGSSGKWVAMGVDVKALTPQAADGMRFLLRTQIGSTNADSVVHPHPVPFGEWTRAVHAIQVTDDAADNVDAFVWPDALDPGTHYRARRSVVVYGDSEEEVRQLAAMYWDGNTSPDSQHGTEWVGSANNSASNLIRLAEVDTDRVNVYRAVNDGDYEMIAYNVPPNTAVTDFAPTVNGTNHYRVEAVSAIPSSSRQELSLVTPGPSDGNPSVWLSAGPGFSQVCNGWANISVSSNTDLRDRELHYFAGRTKPLEFAGQAETRSWSVSLTLLGLGLETPESTPEEWLELAAQKGPFLLRTPDGLYRHVSVRGLLVSRSVGGPSHIVSFGATEVDRD